jgi:hypothetical protein
MKEIECKLGYWNVIVWNFHPFMFFFVWSNLFLKAFAMKFINVNPTCLLHLIVVYYIELHDWKKIDFVTTSTTQFHHLHSRIFLKKLNPSFSHHSLLTHKGERSFFFKNSIKNIIQLQNILYYIFIITKTRFFVNIISIKMVMKSEIKES